MESLVSPKEKRYFTVCLVISILAYLVLILSFVGIPYIIIGGIVSMVIHGIFIGTLRGNAVRVSENQFPELYRLAERYAKQMNLNPLPAIYVIQAGGLINAFATWFPFRRFVVIYADVLELGYNEGESALGFIVCHELAHVKRGHIVWLWLLYPALLIPLLGTAYSRACEYTCDRFAAHYEPEGAINGLLVLAAGKRLYRNVDKQEFSKQAKEERGFFIWLAEILSTHPHLSKRVDALQNLSTASHPAYPLSTN